MRRRLGFSIAWSGALLALVTGSSAVPPLGVAVPGRAGAVAKVHVDRTPPQASGAPRNVARLASARPAAAPQAATRPDDRATAATPTAPASPTAPDTVGTSARRPVGSGSAAVALTRTPPPTGAPRPTPVPYTGRVVVKLKNSTDPTRLTRAAAAAGAQVAVGRRTATGASVVTPTGDVISAATAIAAQSGIEYAVPERRFTVASVPNDPAYSRQWDLPAIGLPLAWASGDGTGVTVAVIDTGRLDHPDLQGRYLPGYDFISDPAYSLDGSGRDADPGDVGDWAPAGLCGPVATSSSWHGLHVTGTIAALTGNGFGIAGIAPGAAVLPVRALGRCGGTNVDVADALVWSAGGTVPGVPVNPRPARVINLSLGGPGACTPVEQGAIDIARSRGALVVVAAGNEGADVAGYSPANCRGVLVVGANDQAGTPADYANRGPAVALSAPGTGILGLGNGGSKGLDPAAWSIVSRSGTSMATPHVSAVAALVWSAVPTATADEVRAALIQTARPFPVPTSGRGAGLLDAQAAVTLLRGALGAPPVVTRVTPAGARAATGGTVAVVGTGLGGATATVGGRPVAVVSASASALILSIPAGTAGPVPLVVRTVAGSASFPFFYDTRRVVGRVGGVFRPAS